MIMVSHSLAPLAHLPGINFDEVEFHQVYARRQVERLFYVGARTLDTVTSANFSKNAACGDFAAVPSLEILLIIKRRDVDCRTYCGWRKQSATLDGEKKKKIEVERRHA